MDDSLSHRLDNVRKPCQLLGLQFTRRIKEIDHSQFIDDTLLLGGASVVIETMFTYVLDSYLNAFGVCVNKQKDACMHGIFLQDYLIQ